MTRALSAEQLDAVERLIGEGVCAGCGVPRSHWDVRASWVSVVQRDFNLNVIVCSQSCLYVVFPRWPKIEGCP